MIHLNIALSMVVSRHFGVEKATCFTWLQNEFLLRSPVYRSAHFIILPEKMPLHKAAGLLQLYLAVGQNLGTPHPRDPPFKMNQTKGGGYPKTGI